MSGQLILYNLSLSQSKNTTIQYFGERTKCLYFSFSYADIKHNICAAQTNQSLAKRPLPLLDRYGVDVVSLAVLADTDRGFRPERYQRGRWGCQLDFCFPMVKLLDMNERWEALVSSDNVFALVVMAQLKAKLATNATERRHWKTHLVRLMYQRHYQKPEILQLSG